MRTRLKVKEAIDGKGWSIAKAARRADLAYRTVHDLTTNPYKDVTVGTLTRIAEALEVPVESLIETEEDG